MRARELSNCIREENTRYTVVWVLLQLWKTEARTVTSSPDAKKLVPEGVEGRVAYKGMRRRYGIPAAWRSCVLVWDTVEPKDIEDTEGDAEDL